MKYFIKRMILFSSPLIIYVLVALYIDPYNIIHRESNPNLIELKAQISYSLNYPLYKCNAYSVNPTDIVLLGDSRVDMLHTSTFDSITKMKSTNMAYGGGTLPEIVETFWYVIGIHNIKEVYVGINFNLYSKNNSMNRVNEAIILKNSPISYLFSQYCLKSIFLIIKSMLTKEVVNIEKPNFNKADFWKYQLESSANNFYRDYSYPDYYHKKLIEISSYCKKKNIKLVFFIPPTHIDLQQKVNEFKLVSAENRFKSDIENLGLFYDFDYSNTMTDNRDNFNDPFHCTDSIARIVTNEIATGHTNYARTHNKGYIQ